MMNEYTIRKYFPKFTEKELREKLIEACQIQSFEADTVLMEVGKYVKVLPLVIEGSIKVLKEDDKREILMYYIQSGESCIMSISACINQEKSQIKAIAEEPVTLILVPPRYVNEWLRVFPTWNSFVIASYQSRFETMLNAFEAVAFQKMDSRLVHYLQQKSSITGQRVLKITHQQIANELATARVVVSRLLKDLEKQGIIKQGRGTIEFRAKQV